MICFFIQDYGFEVGLIVKRKKICLHNFGGCVAASNLQTFPPANQQGRITTPFPPPADVHGMENSKVIFGSWGLIWISHIRSQLWSCKTWYYIATWYVGVVIAWIVSEGYTSWHPHQVIWKEFDEDSMPSNVERGYIIDMNMLKACRGWGMDLRTLLAINGSIGAQHFI